MIIILGISSFSRSAVSIRVCEDDGITPFDGRSIMVGTDLTIIISSDSGGGTMFPPMLAIPDQYKDMAELTNCNQLPAAGENAFITEIHGDVMGLGIFHGFSVETGFDSVEGDWFIVDYTSLAPGDPNIVFYDFFVNMSEPIETITISQIPTRNFNEDDVVNLQDFDILASYWQVTNCDDLDHCNDADIDADGDVDMDDLVLFMEYWLYEL